MCTDEGGTRVSAYVARLSKKNSVSHTRSQACQVRLGPQSDARQICHSLLIGTSVHRTQEKPSGSPSPPGHSSHLGTRIARATSPPRPPSPAPHCCAMLRGEEGARKQALSGSPLSTSGVAAKLERGVGGVRTPRRGLDKLNADGVCDGRSALRNVMNGQVERGSRKNAPQYPREVSESFWLPPLHAAMRSWRGGPGG